MRHLMLTLFLLLTTLPLNAQDADTLPEPERVEVTAPDGIVLVGDYYVAPDVSGEMPSLLLLHGSGGNRRNWNGLIAPLLEAGFNVLTVDQRAHGETGGERDLIAMSDDTLVWMDWLRDLPEVDDNGISIIGMSMGAVPAIAGCAADPACVTAIAVSPGDFPTLDEAMFELLSERSVLFIVGRDDNVLFDTRKLFDRTSGEAALQIYDSSAHAAQFWHPTGSLRVSVIDLMLNWLHDHLERRPTDA